MSTNVTRPFSVLHATPLSPTVIACTLFLFSCLLLASVLCNCLVIITFKSCSKLHTVTNYFIVSLAIADLLISMVSLPLWMVTVSQGLPPIPPNMLLNRIWIFSDIVGSSASIFNLSMISYERYLCISRPLSTHLKGKRATFCLAMVWVLAVTLASLHRTVFNPKYVPLRVSTTVLALLCFFLPLFFMAYNYLQILRLARYQLYKINTTMPRHVTATLRKELKAAKTIAIIIGVFVLCWIPFFGLNLIYGLCKCWRNISKNVVITVKWSHYFNSLLNPVIYTWRNREFREVFLRLVHSTALYSTPREPRLQNLHDGDKIDCAQATLKKGVTGQVLGTEIENQSTKLCTTSNSV